MCGSPGAGKTTVAAAAARHLGLPVLTRDEIKAGLALSSARVTADGTVEYHPDAHIAGGPLAQRAEEVMNRTARLLASAGVSFVVESSVLSDLDTSAGGDPPVELIEAAVGRLMDQAGGNG